VEIAIGSEWLPDDARSYDLSVFYDQLSVRFVVEKSLCQPGYHKWVNDSEYDRGGDRH
jgi:hypothetical protein